MDGTPLDLNPRLKTRLMLVEDLLVTSRLLVTRIEQGHLSRFVMMLVTEDSSGSGSVETKKRLSGHGQMVRTRETSDCGGTPNGLKGCVCIVA